MIDGEKYQFELIRDAQLVINTFEVQPKGGSADADSLCGLFTRARRWTYFGLLRGSSSGPVYGAAFAWPPNAGALIGEVADATCRP